MKGLTGTVTSSQTVTLSADEYLLRTTAANPASFIMTATGTFTVNVGTSGPVANGRDVGPVFSSTFVHVYAITTGFASTTPAGIASTTPPPTGPVLPSSYSGWTYLGTYPYSSASTTFTAGHRPRGCWSWYEGQQTVLSNGTSTVEASVVLSSTVPSNALNVMLTLGANAFVAGAAYTMTFRVVTGVDFASLVALVPSQNAANLRSMLIPNFPSVFYLNNITSGQSTIQVSGYSVANGGE